MKKLDIVGFGPGSREGMTIAASLAIESCDVIVGFTTYVEIIKSFFPQKEYIATGMGAEVERTREALELANQDKHVCLVCSGDSQVYGMAGLAYELSVDYPEVEITTIPGVTAALSGSAILGSAAGNDLCTISLSDYHTSWENIEEKLKCCAKCDFVIALYNPRSKKRPDGLKRACVALMEVVEDSRICGVVTNIGRVGEKSQIMSIEELQNYEADMYTTVFIGNSKSVLVNGKMVTPRGYKLG